MDFKLFKTKHGKGEKLARVRYIGKLDTFAVEIKVDGVWEISHLYECRATHGTDADSVHFSALWELVRLSESGFKIIKGE